jgi:ADP-ribosylglycohydrolase/uncharacterized protein YegL
LNQPDRLDELDTLFGPAAVMDLDQRGLLPRFEGVDRAVTKGAADRIAGALLGAVVGNAVGLPSRHLTAAEVRERFGADHGVLRSSRRLPQGALGAEGRLVVSWAGALARDGRRAAPALADRLAHDRPRNLRGPGQAIVETIDRLGQGAPWYAAGPDSFGNGALLRAVVDGARWATDAAWRPRSAALGCLVTHAHPRAVAASVVLAEMVAAGVADPDALTDPVGLARDLADRVEDDELAAALRGLPRTPGQHPEAHHSLAQGIALFAQHDSTEAGMRAAADAGGASDIVAGVVGALHGARDGTKAMPAAADGVEQRNRVRRRAWRIAEAQGLPLGRRVATKRPEPKAPKADDVEPVHIWFLIDRSGSMNGLARAVVDGFNGFLADQKAAPGRARLTLVQFDGHDPYEVLIDGKRLEQVAPLRHGQYQPRGSTPLYDATGSLIDVAERRIEDRRRRGKPAEDQLVVVFTDGMENASRRWDRAEIFARIDEKKAEGWTFVYLGANQDSYGVGRDLGVAQGSVSNWSPSPSGYLAASASVSRAAVAYRRKPRAKRHTDADDFFEGVKEAESPPR